jgi:hypothetical protein
MVRCPVDSGVTVTRLELTILIKAKMPQVVVYRGKVEAWGDAGVVRVVALKKAKVKARVEVAGADQELVFLRMPAE